MADETNVPPDRDDPANAPVSATDVPHARTGRARLAAWQVERAKALMALDPRPSQSLLVDVSLELGMSANHFAKAFANTTGIAPYQWFVRHRIARSLARLIEDGVTLSTVATESGFADQSHFTRMFRRVVGMTPGRWRSEARSHGDGAVAMLDQTRSRMDQDVGIA